jgi:threonine dehydratase
VIFDAFERVAFEEARARMGTHVYRTPLLTSRILSERTGFDVRLKAEMFQRGGSYKIRGPMNKFSYLTDAEKRRGVICSSAGNHAQGVAIAAAVYGIRAVVVMAENATRSKIDATRAYGAEVVLHGTIWDEANEMSPSCRSEAAASSRGWRPRSRAAIPTSGLSASSHPALRR